MRAPFDLGVTVTSVSHVTSLSACLTLTVVQFSSSSRASNRALPARRMSPVHMSRLPLSDVHPAGVDNYIVLEVDVGTFSQASIISRARGRKIFC